METLLQHSSDDPTNAISAGIRPPPWPMIQLQSFSGGCLLSLILVQLFPEALSSATGHAEVPLSGMNIQGSTRRRALGLVNFVPALAFHFYLNLPCSIHATWRPPISGAPYVIVLLSLHPHVNHMVYFSKRMPTTS